MDYRHLHWFTVSMAIFAIAFGICSCSCTISLANTQGKASDVIDETSTQTPETSVTIPLIPGV